MGFKKGSEGRGTGGLKSKSVVRKVRVKDDVKTLRVASSLIDQVEKDHLNDSFIYRARKNIAEMLRKEPRTPRHSTGSVIRALVLVVVLALTLTQTGPLFAGRSEVKAETAINRWGTVTGSGVNLREGPDSGTKQLANLPRNTKVYVMSQVKGQNTTSYGDQWYKLSYTAADGKKIEGYMVADLVKLDEDVPADDKYYKEFKALGFPSSYWPALRDLKIKYPNWTFTPVMIDAKYDWDTILKNQEVPGRSLIPGTWSNYLSTHYGLVKENYDGLKAYGSDAYNYKDDKWKIHDSGGWVMANRATIAHYMDPRNWLYEDTIFMFENLKYNKDVHTRKGVESILKGTFMDGREKYTVQKYDKNNKAVGGKVSGTQIDFFMEAADMSKVSPYHLASRSIQEVGGKSGSVTGNYEDPYNQLNLKGLYNYYNIGASQGEHPIRNGLIYASRKPSDNHYLRPWNSPWRAIVGGAMFISEEYISHNQHTLYLQKFDLIYDNKYGVFWHQYMGNILAPYSEAKGTFKAYKDMGQLNNNFEFIIPVINGLPDAPAPLPTDARNKNPWLKTLDVSGLALNQKFDPAKREYSVTLNYDFEAVTVSATTVNSKAKTDGTGTYKIMPGTNIIVVTGIAEGGQKREYTVSIIRKAKDGSVPPDIHRPQDPIPSLNFTQKDISVQGITMTGLDPAKNLNTVEQFVSSLGIPAGYQVQVLKANGKPQTDLIGTGSIVRISYENLFSQDYTIVIYGDTNGDGRISSADLNQLFNHVLQKSSLSGAYESAADVNKDGRVTSADLNQLFNHVLQKSSIKQ